DNAVFGGPELSTAERTAQFAEFVAGLDAALTDPVADVDGRHVTARDVRSIPGCVQQPRVPFVIGALGPKAMRLAAVHGQAWVTTGWGGDTDDEYWTGAAELIERFREVCADAGREWDSIDRMLLLDAASPMFSLESAATAEDQLGRAAELGFTDAVIHRPRTDGIYAGNLAVLDHFAAEILPATRTGGGGPTAPDPGR
ncbi:MAG: LLM class flavin-dependent oxidoreductase, partial [Actinomycetota bacterium]